jgi:hypothetical protein
MTNVNDRPILTAPNCKEASDVGFGGGIIPRCIGGVVVGVERLLHVDDQWSRFASMQHKTALVCINPRSRYDSKFRSWSTSPRLKARRRSNRRRAGWVS